MTPDAKIELCAPAAMLLAALWAKYGRQDWCPSCGESLMADGTHYMSDWCRKPAPLPTDGKEKP